MHKLSRNEAGPSFRPADYMNNREESCTLVAQLGPSHRSRILAHLVELSEDDRRLRFGHQISEASMARYVRSIRFFRDAVFGVVDPHGQVLGFAHLAFGDEDAEFALSVSAAARRRGLGLELLRRAGEHARNRGHRVMTMVYMPENTALAALAHKAAMHIVCEPSECRAHIGLEPGTPASLLGEAWRETLAAIDLGLRLGRTSANVTSA